MPGESPDEAADGITGIGRAEVLAWWERVKNGTCSENNGDADDDEASHIALCLARGYGPTKFRHMTESDERRRAARFDCLQLLRA